MLLIGLAMVIGLAGLVWSADRFVDGAAASASHFGLPPLLVGMLVVGFGTSAPEMVVSATAALEGNPGLALGNAYGSNIANIALILGLTALISPIAVDSRILRKELPLLVVLTLLCGGLLVDEFLSRGDALALMALFSLAMGWLIRQGLQQGSDSFADEMTGELARHPMPLAKALFWLLVGLILLVASSRLLVWGAVGMAQGFGVSDLIIGLTIVAIGTSLPELASSLMAIRKGEHDIALGNVIGSNIFNTLAVVGIAAGIHPLKVDPLVLSRDWMVMMALTLAIFIFGYGFKRPGRINRLEGGLLLSVFIGYTGYLVAAVIAA